MNHFLYFFIRPRFLPSYYTVLLTLVILLTGSCDQCANKHVQDPSLPIPLPHPSSITQPIQENDLTNAASYAHQRTAGAPVDSLANPNTLLIAPQGPPKDTIVAQPSTLTDTLASTNSTIVPPVQAGPPKKNLGIPNIGNTCYMNSTMQILATFYPTIFNHKKGPLAEAAKGFIRTVTKQDYIKDEQKRASDLRKKTIEFREALSLSDTLGEKGGINWPQKYVQEDAQELITKILSWTDTPTFTLQSQGYNESIQQEALFTTNDPSYMLNIHPALSTMQSLVDSLFVPESITNPDNYYYSEEKKHSLPYTNHLKLNNIHQLGEQPLVVMLTRYTYDHKSNRIVKRLECVKDTDRLVLHSKYMTGNKNTSDLSYQLVAFIHHLGSSPTSGHYISYVNANNQWLKYNDSQITYPSDAMIKQAAEEAYIFFYKKVEASAAKKAAAPGQAGGLSSNKKMMGSPVMDNKGLNRSAMP